MSHYICRLDEADAAGLARIGGPHHARLRAS